MVKLNYKTRNGTSPQGKPRVYFCCHPEDFSGCFEAVSDEVLALQNCAVWYPEEPGAVRDEAFWEDLAGMQLFVMPVTGRALGGENPALDREFPFALQHRIPVLPLLMEEGLETLFDRRCGDLQALDRTASDPTAIPYAAKLERYLERVLVGDGLARRIRDSFDGYLFLSYRKKDRRQARELMKYIHAHTFCRDLAIWYDEFLDPGEDFNEAIGRALEKSDLFVLAVTPSLLEKAVDGRGREQDNYIMTTEYPLARRQGKPILAAQLEDTDRAQLEARFRDIPPCTDARDDRALAQALRERMEGLPGRGDRDTVEHDYLMGLAYLSGVDVEVDHGRAVPLITQAAQSGLMEAAEKLAEMYETGLGVERDYEQSAHWLEHVVELARQAYGAGRGQAELERLCWAAMECGDWFRALGRPDRAEGYYRLAAETEQTRRARRLRAAGYDRLCLSCKERGDLRSAEKYGEKAMDLYRRLSEETGTVGAALDLAMVFDRMCDICLERGETERAGGYADRAMTVRRALARGSEDAQLHRLLAVSCDRCGNVCRQRGDMAGAQEHYSQALALREELAARMGRPRLRRELAVSYDKLGDVLFAAGDRDRAGEHYTRAFRLLQELEQEIGVPVYRDDLGTVCYHLHRVFGSGETDWLGRAVAIFEQLCAACPQVARYRTVLDRLTAGQS